MVSLLMARCQMIVGNTVISTHISRKIFISSITFQPFGIHQEESLILIISSFQYSLTLAIILFKKCVSPQAQSIDRVFITMLYYSDSIY